MLICVFSFFRAAKLEKTPNKRKRNGNYMLRDPENAGHPDLRPGRLPGRNGPPRPADRFRHPQFRLLSQHARSFTILDCILDTSPQQNPNKFGFVFDFGCAQDTLASAMLK